MIWDYWPLRQLWCRINGHDFRLVRDDSALQYQGWIICASCLKAVHWVASPDCRVNHPGWNPNKEKVK